MPDRRNLQTGQANRPHLPPTKARERNSPRSIDSRSNGATHRPQPFTDSPLLRHLPLTQTYFLSGAAGLSAVFSTGFSDGGSADISTGALAPLKYSRLASCFSFFRYPGSSLSWTSNRASCSLRSSFTLASSSCRAGVLSYNLLIW